MRGRARAQQKQSSMPIERYVEVLKGLKMLAVTLTRCETRVDVAAAKDAFATDTGVPTSVKDSATYVAADGCVAVTHGYVLTARHGRKAFFRLQAEFSVIFEYHEGFDEAFFERFRSTSLPLVTWPYLRELVASMTGRMALPSLSLGLWKVPFA